MTIKNFLSVLNLQVRYSIVDRFTKQELYNNYNFKGVFNKNLLDKNIYMVFNGKNDNLDILIF